MKFLHAADIHLDSPLQGLERYEGAPVELIRGATRRALENLVDLSIHHKVDFVIIAGDLYDGDWRDFNTGMFFIRQMAKLRESGIRVYLIAGNHDAVSTMTRKLRLPTNPEGDSLMLPHDQPTTRRLDHLGVALHGRSFANQAETKNMVPDYPVSVPHWFNIGLLHTSLNGSDEHDTYAPCTFADLEAKRYNYWALGHIHKRSLSPNQKSDPNVPLMLYSGNIQGRHIRETGDRGCFIVSVDERYGITVEFHSLDVFRWEVCSVPCGDAITVDDVFELVGKKLRSLIHLHQEMPLGVRVILHGETKAHQELASQRESITAEIRSIATILSDGKIWIEQVKVTTSYLQERDLVLGADGPLADLVRYLDEIPYNPELLSALSAELKELTKKLPGELIQSPDGLRFNQLDWLKEVVRDIKPMLLKRLQG